jgi:hypothetical protein
MRWIRGSGDGSHDDGVDRLLELGHPEELNELSAFAEDLRTAFPDPRVDDSVQHAHLAAMAEAARPNTAATGSTPAVRAATRPMSLPPTARRNPVFKSLAAKITAVAVVAFASLGGLATAGALPRPLQHGVARVADTVGLNLPDPDELDDQSGDELEPSDESGTNDEAGDQGSSGDNNESGDNNDQTGQSGDDGTSDDSTDQSDDQATSVAGTDESGDNNDQGEDNNDQADPGTSSDSTNEQGGDQSDDQGDQGTSSDSNDQGGDQSDDQGGE